MDTPNGYTLVTTIDAMRAKDWERLAEERDTLLAQNKELLRQLEAAKLAAQVTKG